jgi:murein L,D-transpeptidase YcbB/YkuD
MSKIALGLLLVALCSPMAAAKTSMEDELNGYLDTLFSTGSLNIQGLPILTGPLLARFYEHRNYQRAWSDASKVEQLLALLASAEKDGLDPEDYYLSNLRAMSVNAGADSLASTTEREMLYTESFIRYAYHQRFGKVNPNTLVSTWNFQDEITPDVDPVITLNEAVESESLAEFRSRRIPRGPLYQNVQRALQQYRTVAAAGGWRSVSEGKMLRAGDRDARVPELRQRLLVTGDLTDSATPADPQLFDDALDAAVKRFQARHGLDADGAVGPGTLGAMNVPVSARVDQLRLTLERARWVFGSLDSSFVLVNIAGAEVYVVEDGERVWQRRAMVGKTYRKTPIFRGLMTYLDINPTWTVPPGILRNDVLPKVRQDPDYLARSNMSVLDRSGKPIDPSTVDWNALKGMPYTFRQEPGPTNSLGLIKFMFPNEHFVFLHDTPNRTLFSRADRNFSSGCIRVEDPFLLASILLRGQDDWNEQAVVAAVETGQTRRVSLNQPWPVYILYWTAEADGTGQVRFFRDAYQRDAALLEALDADAVIEPRMTMAVASNGS